MAPDLHFEEEQISPSAHAAREQKERLSWSAWLVAKGLVKTEAQANYILIGAASVLLLAAIFNVLNNMTPAPVVQNFSQKDGVLPTSTQPTTP